VKATLKDIRITPSVTADGFTFYSADLEVGGKPYAAAGALNTGKGGPWLTVRARLSEHRARALLGDDAAWLALGDPVLGVIRDALLAPLGIVAECSCGAVYTATAWAKLEIVGNVDDVLQQRNCGCGSTSSAELTREPTLTEALAAQGFEHRKSARGYSHEILRDDEVVFVGTAAETWAWLKGRDMGIPPLHCVWCRGSGFTSAGVMCGICGGTGGAPKGDASC
jgi:hypothetical protein